MTTKWKPGQSGNPAGRAKKDPELEAMLKSYCPLAISALVSIMRNPKASDRARVMAANSILDRGMGKPVQRLAADPDSGPIVVQVLTLTDPSEAEGDS
jgi:hypothetical protein